MDYNTRMFALTPFPYGGRHLKPGDEFFATSIDAGYLTRQGRAEESKLVEPDAPEQDTPLPRRGRPRREPIAVAEVANEPTEVHVDTTPQADFTPHFNPPPD